MLLGTQGQLCSCSCDLQVTSREPLSRLCFVASCPKAFSPKSELQNLSKTSLSSHHPLSLQPTSVDISPCLCPVKVPAALLPAPLFPSPGLPIPSPQDLACPPVLSPSPVCPPSYLICPSSPPDLSQHFSHPVLPCHVPPLCPWGCYSALRLLPAHPSCSFLLSHIWGHMGFSLGGRGVRLFIGPEMGSQSPSLTLKNVPGTSQVFSKYQ